jgi:hypothetical protein
VAHVHNRNACQCRGAPLSDSRSSPAAADSMRLQCLSRWELTLTHGVTGKDGGRRKGCCCCYIWFLASRKVVAAEMDRQGREGWMDPCLEGGEDFFGFLLST